jgi:predicted ATP-dependent endonuclease of OLD family
MNYWLVRANWGSKNKTTQFIQNDEWINGYSDKYLDTVNRVEEGDILLLADNSLINYYGVCVANDGDGRHLLVDSWKKFGDSLVFPAKGAYIKAIVKINDKELIEKNKLAIEKLKEEASIYIKSINLTNFTLFRENYLEFSAGLNVIIGENGTGKTQLLKLLYALIQSNNKLIDNMLSARFPIILGEPKFIFENKIKSILNPELIENLITKNESETKISLNLDRYIIKLNIDKNREIQFNKTNTKRYEKIALFIPAKEILSFYTGFRSIYSQTSFDETFDDLANHLGRLVPKNRYMEKFEENILTELEEILEGKIILDNDRFYLLEKDGNRREITLVAEGLRKLGIIFHLINNGTIQKNSVIFWDEPEANLNPKLIAMIVDMLITLSENGIQIFIATHNYFMIKYFDIRKKEKKSIELKFISLFKKDGQVDSETATDIYDLKHNAIIDEMENIYLESSKLFHKGKE